LLAFLVALAGLAAPAVSGGATAQPRYERDRPGGIQPLDRLLPGIRRQHPGNFYDAEGPTYGPTGDPHYHLKWMTPDGRVIWYDTDARNGRVLRSSPGRDSFDGPPPPGYARPYGGPGGYGQPYPYGRRFNPESGYARPYGGPPGGGRFEGGGRFQGGGREGGRDSGRWRH